MTDEKCALCRFFFVNAQKLGSGWCRYNPPQVVLIPGPSKGSFGVAAHFPEMHGDRGWCGQFKPRLAS